MKEVSWMTDYLPAHLLGMAQQAERRFGDCLMSCPKTGDGTIEIDDPEVFTRLLEARITSLLLAVAALQAFLGFYAYETAKKIEEQLPGVTLHDYLEKKRLFDLVKNLPNRLKKRHETIMEEHGPRPLYRFLTAVPLSLEDKLLYWPMIRAGKTLNYKDGYVKKLTRVIAIRDELTSPDLANAPELRRAAAIADISRVFLHHDLPARLTPGKSCSADYVVEAYTEHNFFWELLHIYPDRAAQEAIQYLLWLDQSENHFIVAQTAAELVDASGAPITEAVKKYVIEVRLEARDEKG